MRDNPVTLDVVIPARGESATLAACLESLTRDSAGVDLQIIVVANGPERARSVGVATRYITWCAAAGVDLRVVEEPTPGKANALNLGDDLRRGAGVMYLDADTMILPGTLASLAWKLETTREPVLSAPPPKLFKPRDVLARHFALVWASLPAVANDVMGGGCYAVNAEGRERWGRFPLVFGDDAYVQSRFARSERQLTSEGGFLRVLPEGDALLESVRRWRAGNRELRAVPRGPDAEADSRRGSDPGANLTTNLVHVLRRPALWPFLIGFLTVTIRARTLPRRILGASWVPSGGAAAGLGHPDPAPPILRVSVGGCAASEAASVIPTLVSDWSALIADDPGPDETEASHLLIVDAAAPPPAGMIDQLLALALRFPESGVLATQTRPSRVRSLHALRRAPSLWLRITKREGYLPGGLVLVRARTPTNVRADHAGSWADIPASRNRSTRKPHNID